MKEIKTAHELYCEILKSFFFGAYKKDDKLMTYQEAHEAYGLAKNTIGVAYNMLRHDGFIRTDGSNGTIVTFDLNNHDHVAKVPLVWPRAGPKVTIPYEIAMRIHAHSLYMGLAHSNESQLHACQKIIEDIIQRVKDDNAYHNQVFAFWTCAISSLDNELLSRITDHFISKYLYLLPPTHLSVLQKRLISDSAIKYYSFVLDAIDRKNFDEFPDYFERHYHNHYLYGGVVFSKLEDASVFKEQALYESLLDELCIRILSGELKKGDNLPSTKSLCAEYGISTTTVNRTYGILTEMGFISRHVGSGTKLIADPGDPKILETMERVAGLDQHAWKNAVEILVIINSVLSKRLIIPSEVVSKMQAELASQNKRFESYLAPFSVTTVLLNPLVAILPAGIVHKYYSQIADVLSKVVTLCTFRIPGNNELGKEIYQLMYEALKALEDGNQSLYSILSERAIIRNAEVLFNDYNSASRGTADNLNSAIDIV